MKYFKATDVVNEWSNDERYQQTRAARLREINEHAKSLREDERPIISDLQEAGLTLGSVGELLEVRDRAARRSALPVLMKHLRLRVYKDQTRERLARACAVPSAIRYWDELRELYETAQGPFEAEGLAVAMASTAAREQYAALVEIVEVDAAPFDFRAHFMRPIRKLGGSDGRIVLETLVGDPNLGPAAKQELRLAKP